MSEVADSARVTLIAADFANTDAAGKLNMIGAGVTVTRLLTQTGLTAPQALVLVVSVDPAFVGQQYALEVGLYGADGELVLEPGPLDPKPIRVTQLILVEAANHQGMYAPPGAIWPATQMIVNFQNGLPLAAGSGYVWKASIDGTEVATLGLGVLGPPPTLIG